MPISISKKSVDNKALIPYLESVLGPLSDIKATSDVLLLPDIYDTGKDILNSHTVSVCSYLIGNGLRAKILACDNFSYGTSSENIISLPTMVFFDPTLVSSAFSSLEQWLLKKEGNSVIVSYILFDESSLVLDKHVVTGNVSEISEYFLN